MPKAFPITNGMDPKEKDLLLRTFEFSKENNSMLKSMRSSARWGRFIRLIYWLVIIGASIWLYYYLQPFLSEIMEIYGQALDLKDSFQFPGQ